MAAMQYHVIERTSPKGPGQKFIGTCRLCGARDLPVSAACEPCENWRGLSHGDAVSEAVNGTVEPHPEDRPDWPLPSFDAVDWAKAFCKIATNLGYKDADGQPIDEGWMVTWFANSLMRGFDEHAKRQALATPPAPTPSAASLPREGKTIEEQIASAQGHDLLSLLRDYLSINLKPSGDLARLYIARITAILAAPPSAAREKIARVIDPSAFKNWQGQYDYGLKANSNEPEARRCADYFHKAACDEALAKADAILALLPDAAAIRAAAFEEAAKIAKAKYADPAWAPTYHIASEGIAAAIRAGGTANV